MPSSAIGAIHVAIVREDLHILDRDVREVSTEEIFDFITYARSQELCVIFPDRAVMVCWNGGSAFNATTLTGEGIDVWHNDQFPDAGYVSPETRRRVRDYIIEKMQKLFAEEAAEDDSN